MKRILKKIIFLLTILTHGYVLFAQGIDHTLNEKGIRFETIADWAKIKEKAKAENKYIFLDCYATWCGPCKAMDQQIYPNDMIGRYMNSRFISVKMQMDKTPSDDERVKSFYGLANFLAGTYTINAYPTYLFFSPDGKAVHKAIGAKLTVASFLSVAKDAQDTAKQYYSVLRNYKSGKLDTAEMKGLAKVLSSGTENDRVLSRQIATEYLGQLLPLKFYETDNLNFIRSFGKDVNVRKIVYEYVRRYKPKDFEDERHQQLLNIFKEDVEFQQVVLSYLSQLRDNQLTKKENLSLMIKYYTVIKPKDRYFKLFYDDHTKIDTIFHSPGYSASVVDASLYYNLVALELKMPDSLHQDADWGKLYDKLRELTDTAYSRRNVASAKLRFYRTELKKAEQKNSDERFFWGKKLATLRAHQWTINEIKADSNEKNAEYYDDVAYSPIFMYSNEKPELEIALVMIDKALSMTKKNEAEMTDTKANLLYKLGKNKNEAIQLESKAVALNPNNSEITTNLRNMQAGRPTWPVPLGQ